MGLSLLLFVAFSLSSRWERGMSASEDVRLRKGRLWDLTSVGEGNEM